MTNGFKSTINYGCRGCTIYNSTNRLTLNDSDAPIVLTVFSCKQLNSNLNHCKHKTG